MGCGTAFMKCILIVCNIVVGIVGVAILALGIALKVTSTDKVNEYANTYIKGLIQLPAQYNYSGYNQPESTPELDVSQFLEPVAIALIIIGLFLTIVAILGGFGACCSNRLFLGVYAIIGILLIITQLILTIIFFTKGADAKLQQTAMDSLVKEYVDIDDFGLHSLTWNYVMLSFNCCGLNDYEDFKQAEKWRRTREVVVGSSAVTVNLTTPISCCKMVGEFPDIKIKDDTCATVPTEATSNYKKGCWDAVTKLLHQYRAAAIGIISMFLIIQTLFVVLAIGVACMITQEKGTYA